MVFHSNELIEQEGKCFPIAYFLPSLLGQVICLNSVPWFCLKVTADECASCWCETSLTKNDVTGQTKINNQK